MEIRIPDIGDFTDVPIIEIHVAPGDTVAPEDPLVTLESDKATMDVPSPAAGTVGELRVAVGDDAVALAATVNQCAFDAGVVLTELRAVRTNLEDRYLAMVTGGDR